MLNWTISQVWRQNGFLSVSGFLGSALHLAVTLEMFPTQSSLVGSYTYIFSSFLYILFFFFSSTTLLMLLRMPLPFCPLSNSSFEWHFKCHLFQEAFPFPSEKSLLLSFEPAIHFTNISFTVFKTFDCVCVFSPQEAISSSGLETRHDLLLLPSDLPRESTQQMYWMNDWMNEVKGTASTLLNELCSAYYLVKGFLSHW